MPRERYAMQSLGVTLKRVIESRVLLVGAGGIGCELLKNLVLMGFGQVHIIDLDTIDLSNLNRQFLFRYEHIKKPKALVAKEVARRFNPKVKLVAYHANIKDAQFNVAWFSQFTLVFNALDNLEARRHVNKMCLAADIPLIESGTTGFNGQVQVIRKGVTACYDCSPKTTPKSFPVCTIRNTPSQPIHCIVWAKIYLLPELFGESEDVSPELDATEDSGNAEEIAKLKEEAAALKHIRESMSSDSFAKQVFEKVFKDDIVRLATMEEMWRERPVPKPLDYDALTIESEGIDESISAYDQNTWTVAQNFVVFRDSLSRLSKRMADEKAAALRDDDDDDDKNAKDNKSLPIITFDKDDDDVLDFVTATANLRAQIFGIEAKSKFDIKQMAGNIIPAIATTNAMIAGLCVMQAFKVIKGEYQKTKFMFLDRGNMSATISDGPNPDCLVCSAAMARLQVDSGIATLGDVVQEILKTKLGYGDDLSILSETGLVYDPDLEDNLEKKLIDLGLGNSSTITVKDENEEEGEQARVDLHLFVEARTGESDTDGPAVRLVLRDGEILDIPRKPKKAQTEVSLTNGHDDVAHVVTNGAAPEPSGKRKRDADEAELDTGNTAAKKIQLARSSGAEEVTIVEDDDGAIVLDDD